MKKSILFLLFSCLIAFYGFSQSISLADSLGPIANNATLVKTGTPSDAEIVSHVFVKNNTGSAIQVQCRKVELNVVSGSINTFCWGACFGPSIFVTVTPMTIEANHTDSVDFSGHYTAMDISGITHMRYVFFNAANHNDSAWVNVDYAAFPVGIESGSQKAELSNAYPNPANTTTVFSYNIPDGSTAAIQFRNVLGTTVKNVSLEAAQGKAIIATDNLPDGIYLYSLVVDGKNILTRKLIVRH